MKKIITHHTTIFITFVLLVISVMFFVITNNSTVQALAIGNMTTEERLQNAEKQLNKIAKNPNEQNAALVSFNDFKQKEFVADFVAKNSDIKMRQIFYAQVGPYSTSVGGVFIGEEGKLTKEDLSGFEQQLINDIQKFGIDLMKETLDREIEIAERNPNIKIITPLERLSNEKEALKIGDKVNMKITYTENTEQQKMVEGTRNSITNAEHRLASLKENGIQITGLEIITTNKKLVEISKYFGVRAVEIIDTSSNYTRTVPPILPTK